VPDNRRIFVAGQCARPVAEGVSRALALPVALETPTGGFAPVAILRPLVQFAVDLAIYAGEGALGDTRAIVQRPAADDGVEGRDEGGLRRAPVAANGLRQTVTPAGESPGLASDSPKSRSPRAGWRFTCADGLPLAQSAARSLKRGFALLPKWEYNLVTGQYDRLSSTQDYAAAACRMNPIRWAASTYRRREDWIDGTTQGKGSSSCWGYSRSRTRHGMCARRGWSNGLLHRAQHSGTTFFHQPTRDN
jgi:hypothetical protein